VARRLTTPALALAGLLALAGPAAAQDPGLVPPLTDEAGDSRVGSVLIYSLVSSSATAPEAEDTRLSLTNVSPTDPAVVRLFFVDGRVGATPPNTSTAGNVTATTVCLTPNQTASFRASEIRPGVRGFVVAVAVDVVTGGCPSVPSFLGGQAHVRLASGFQGSLEAIGIQKLTPTCVVSTDGSLAALFFDGLPLAGSYNRVPRVLHAVDVPSQADQRTLVVVNRIGGNLATGTAAVGPLAGILTDDAENAFGFSTPSVTSSQLVVEVSDGFPSTAPPLSSVIPAGRTAWMRLFSPNDLGLAGAVLFAAAGPEGPAGLAARPSPPAAPAPSPFATGAVNLTPSTLSPAANLVIPVFPPGC
jgi:hypothetical protein